MQVRERAEVERAFQAAEETGDLEAMARCVLRWHARGCWVSTQQHHCPDAVGRRHITS